MAEQLDRFLARRLGLSWAEARLAIHRRRVSVDGAICNRYHLKLGGGERVLVDGVEIAPAPDAAVLLCHKPAGVACSHEPCDAPLLYDLVPEPLRHPDLQSAGRLDRDTTGLIVLTIDGSLIQRLTSPASGRWKRYRLRYEGALDADAVARVEAGLRLPDDDRPCLPARLTLDGGDAATLELAEGRHHQVKRMTLALGGRVTALHRDRIGALELPGDIARGAMRPATADELALLR